MVKRFFGSVVRIVALLVICVVTVWGIFQAFVELPHAGIINKWLLASFSAIMLWNIRDIGHDFLYWFRQAGKIYNANSTEQG